MARVTLQTNELTSPVWAGDILDREHLVPGGAIVDAAQFLVEDAVVVGVGAAGAAAGATSIPVDALSGAIPSGTILNFGSLAPVTVTINDASISAGDTSITVVALPGPIPAGTRLNFSGGTNAQVVELGVDHAAGATTLTVLPVDGTIANSSTALFPGGTKQARLTAAAAAAATSLTVDELQFALVDADSATYAGTAAYKKVLSSGTPIGRTFAERASGTAFGPADASDEETYLVAFDNPDLAASPDVELYRYGSIVKENFLPNFSTMDAGVLADIRVNYQTTRGVA